MLVAGTIVTVIIAIFPILIITIVTNSNISITIIVTTIKTITPTFLITINTSLWDFFAPCLLLSQGVVAASEGWIAVQGKTATSYQQPKVCPWSTC